MKRRTFLKSTALTVGSLSTPYIFANAARAQDFTNAPKENDPVIFGFNIPQTGPYSAEGEDELRGLKLAVKHLNGEGDGGMLKTMQPSFLKGNGILGRRVDYVVGDTQTDPDAATQSAEKMIKEENALMITGGSSSDVAIAMQDYCDSAGVIFMAGLTHSNDTTGIKKQRYGFRHFFNAYMSGAALGPVLKKEMGTERRAYHLTADYSWGHSVEESIRNTTEAMGWETIGQARTPLGTKDYALFLEEVMKSDADVLVLNHYGDDLIHSLIQTMEAGLREKVIGDKKFEIVVPLLSRLVAQGAGEAVRGILGTANWNWALQDPGSHAFVKSFSQAYGFPPSQAAHTCYVQTLLYANACEMAGTFYPPEVIKALEGLEFDGMGNGPTLYRKEDHQCIKDVLVVRGNEHPSSQFDLLELVEQVPANKVTYDPLIFGGKLGPYEK